MGAGYVSGLVGQFQREIVIQPELQCDRAFARMMRGDIQTDSEVSQKLLAAKHFPPMPAASVDTGFAPSSRPTDWLASYPQLVN